MRITQTKETGDRAFQTENIGPEIPEALLPLDVGSGFKQAHILQVLHLLLMPPWGGVEAAGPGGTQLDLRQWI